LKATADTVVDAQLNEEELIVSRDVEIRSIQLVGEALRGSSYDSTSIRIHILDEVWNDSSPERRRRRIDEEEGASTSRITFTPSWPEFFVSTEAFRSDSLTLSVLTTQGSSSSSPSSSVEAKELCTSTGPSQYSCTIPLSRFRSSEFSIKESIKMEDGREPLTVVIHGCSRESKEDNIIPLLLEAGGMSPDDVMTVRFDDGDDDDDNDNAVLDGGEYEYNEYEGMDDFEDLDDGDGDGDLGKIDRMMSTSRLDLHEEN